MTKNFDDFFRYETYNVAMAEPFNLCVCLPRFTGGQEVAGSSPVAPSAANQRLAKLRCSFFFVWTK